MHVKQYQVEIVNFTSRFIFRIIISKNSKTKDTRYCIDGDMWTQFEVNPFRTKQVRAWEWRTMWTQDTSFHLNWVERFINGVMELNDQAPLTPSFAYCGLRFEPQKNNQSYMQCTNHRRFVAQVAYAHSYSVCVEVVVITAPLQYLTVSKYP